MNICLLGGTFDPVHRGHMLVASVVLERLCPAEVVLVPAGHPWLKAGREIAPAEDRLAMVRLATSGQTGLSVSTIEIQRPGPSYSIDTLREFKSRLQPGDELYFILGWDNLLELQRWREPSEIITLCRLIAVPRIGSRVPDAAMLEDVLSGLSKRVILLEKPEIDISASVIRERIRLGLPINHLVPEAVEIYIREHSLYKNGE